MLTPFQTYFPIGVALLVAAGLAAVMLTAMFNVHLRYGFSSVRLLEVTDAGARFGPVGYEMTLLYLAGLATLALGGPGRLSLDHWLKTRNNTGGNDGRR